MYSEKKHPDERAVEQGGVVNRSNIGDFFLLHQIQHQAPNVLLCCTDLKQTIECLPLRCATLLLTLIPLQKEKGCLDIFSLRVTSFSCFIQFWHPRICICSVYMLIVFFLQIINESAVCRIFRHKSLTTRK